MTQRRRRLLIGLAVLALGGVLALPAVHWWLIGWVRGEPSYHGQPTTFWSRRIQQYGYGVPGMQMHGGRYYVRPYDPLARIKQSLGLAGAYDPFVDREMPFIDPDPDGIPVLTALLGDDEPTVRGFAVVALFRFTEVKGAAGAAKPAILALRRLGTDVTVIPGTVGDRQPTVADIATATLHLIDPDAP
jgi:hypothetical protein